jgi:hypothetical protein
MRVVRFLKLHSFDGGRYQRLHRAIDVARDFAAITIRTKGRKQ